MPMGPVELEVRQLTMLVALRNSRGGEQGIGSQLCSAVAAHNATVRPCRFPTTSTTDGANFSGNFHHGLFFQCAPCRTLRASTENGSSVHILWSCGMDCGRLRRILFYLLR